MLNDADIEIILNGEQQKIMPQSLLAFLHSLALEPAKIAVERNYEIVPRSTYAQVQLSAGDRLEIVHFVGGG
jgi:thiamine biosynthesis protein ThiS